MKGMVCAMVLACFGAAAVSAPPRLPSGPIPDGLGVNIHFTTPQPGEMQMLADGGFTWVRMDYDWNQVEYEKGRYRFTAYETLMNALEEHRIRPILILDYVHRLYDDAQSPHSDEAIAAFAKFAAASAKHFKGRGILWEMYNEPNILPFWRPSVNVQDYIRLATATGKAIREAAPDEAYIGPATSGMDFRFIEECFNAGLLKYWDAVSVHPYRSMPPETVIPDYARLRDLIRRYAPNGKRIPIISGEWGYSSVWSGMDPDAQGKMLPRQWLTNMACDIPLSIWYDWHDDGPDPKEPEHHFGTTLHPTHAGRSPIYDAKPAYVAARTLATQLRGFRFNKRLIVGDRTNHVLLFSRGSDVRVVAWTTDPQGRPATIPAGPGQFSATDHLGRTMPDLTADGRGLSVTLTDSPVYLRPSGRNAALETAARWERLPQEIVTPHRASLTVRATASPPGRKSRAVTKTVRLDRSPKPTEALLELTLPDAGAFVQSTNVVVSNPLVVTVMPPMAGVCQVTVENPAAAALDAVLTLRLTGDAERTERLPVRFREGTRSLVVAAQAPRTGRSGAVVGGELTDRKGTRLVTVPSTRYVAVDDFSTLSPGVAPPPYTVVPDGDAKVASTQTLIVADPPDGPPMPGLRSLQLTYRFETGWKFVRVNAASSTPVPIEGKPREFGVWIHGDGKGNVPRLRFVDATQQTWQPDGDPITWEGWRWVTFALDGTRSGRWGGANDGVIHYPIRWDTLFLLDSPGGRATEGEVFIASPTLIY